MTRDEIMAMRPGVDLDRRIASIVDDMGGAAHSSNDAAALWALERGREKGLWQRWIILSPVPNWDPDFVVRLNAGQWDAAGRTVAIAACRAILLVTSCEGESHG